MSAMVRQQKTIDF